MAEEKKTIEELSEIGRKIGTCIMQIKATMVVTDISEQEIKDFKEYLSTQQAVGPLFKPEFFMYNDGFNKLDQCWARVDLIETVIKKLEEV